MLLHCQGQGLDRHTSNVRLATSDALQSCSFSFSLFLFDDDKQSGLAFT
jgi:uncharacterized protein YgfB (UPF0149 family)